MIILDSNVWIAYLNEEDSQHAKAEQVFSKMISPIILPEYVIVEVSTVLAQQAGKKIANRFLEIVTKNDDIRILMTEEDFFLKVIGAFQERASKKLSCVDAALLVLAKNYPVVTFDRALELAIKNK